MSPAGVPIVTSPLDLARRRRSRSQSVSGTWHPTEKKHSSFDHFNTHPHTHTCVGLLQILQDIYGGWLWRGFGVMLDIRHLIDIANERGIGCTLQGSTALRAALERGGEMVLRPCCASLSRQHTGTSAFASYYIYGFPLIESFLDLLIYLTHPC